MNKVITLAAILFSAIGMAGCDVQGEKEIDPEEKIRAIEKKLTESIGELTQVPPRVEITESPYIQGKIAVFHEVEKKDWDKSKDKKYIMYADSIRKLEEFYAAVPEEATMVGLVACRTIQKGIYKTDDGREMPANVEDCELTLIDRVKKEVIFKKMFEKESSETRRVYANSTIRESASTDIMDFLIALPRK